MQKIQKNNEYSIARIMLLIIAIALSGGALFLNRIALLVLFFLLAGIYFYNTEIHIRKNYIPIYLWIYAVTLLTFSRLTTPELIASITKVAQFLVAMTILSIYRQMGDTFIRDLSRIIYPMTFQAIGTVILKIIIPDAFTSVNFGESTTQTLLFVFNYHNLINENSLLIRPNGFFWEPGVFQIYLNLYVYITLFKLNNPHRAILGTLAVLATQSTTGIITLGILLMAYAAKFSKQILKRHKIRALLATTIALPIFILFAHQNINDKIEGDARGSGLTRQYDLITGLLIAQNNPFIGIGFSKENYVAANLLYGYSNSDLGSDFFAERVGTSNGIVQAFYSIGIPLGLILIIGMLKQRLLGNNKIIFFMLFFSLLGEALTFSPLFLAISFSGIAWTPRRRMSQNITYNTSHRINQ